MKRSGEPDEINGIWFNLEINRESTEFIWEITSYREISFFVDGVEIYSPEDKLKILLVFARKPKKISGLEQQVTGLSRNVKNLANDDR